VQFCAWSKYANILRHPTAIINPSVQPFAITDTDRTKCVLGGLLASALNGGSRAGRPREQKFFWLHGGATSGKQEFMNDFFPLDTLQIPKDVINDLTTCGGQWDAIDIHHDVFELFYLGIKP
jgi:hypothetical protein